jgi:fructosamine-3-kinase
MDGALRTALETALGARVAGADPVAGGDINRAHRLRCGDGRSLFLKTHARPRPGLYRREADGLGWLAETGALRTPAVIAVRDTAPAFLVLEWIEPGSRRATDDEALGRGLAQLHRATATGFGLAHDNFIALLPQSNAAHADTRRALRCTSSIRCSFT